MTQTQFFAAVANISQLSKAQVKLVFQSAEAVVKNDLKAAGKIPLGSLGTVKLVERKARKGRNPATGQAIDIPAKTAVKIAPAKALNRGPFGHKPKGAPPAEGLVLVRVRPLMQYGSTIETTPGRWSLGAIGGQWLWIEPSELDQARDTFFTEDEAATDDLRRQRRDRSLPEVQAEITREWRTARRAAVERYDWAMAEVRVSRLLLPPSERAAAESRIAGVLLDLQQQRAQALSKFEAENPRPTVRPWDQPAVKCAILARPTKSTGLYLQQAGRILRPFEGARAVILDHGGCAVEHGLPQDNRAFSLDAPRRRGRGQPSEPLVCICPDCHAVVPLASTVCPACGAVLRESKAAAVPKEVAGTLVEIPADEGVRQRVEWDRLCAVAAHRGYQPGWAFHRFRERFGKKPPASFTAPPPPPPPPPAPVTPVDKRALWDALCRSGDSPAWARARYHVEVGEPPPDDGA